MPAIANPSRSEARRLSKQADAPGRGKEPIEPGRNLFIGEKACLESFFFQDVRDNSTSPYSQINFKKMTPAGFRVSPFTIRQTRSLGSDQMPADYR